MKTNKQISQKREKAIGKQIGGRNHIASGALWFQKGDVSNEFIIIEDKFTNKDEYSLSLSVLNKIEKESKKESKVPILSIGFHNHAFSLACINAKYCKKSFTSELNISTSKNSCIIRYEQLKKAYIESKEETLLFIDFNEHERKRFYLFEWSSFIENMESIIYI